ncbi:hypothetical protein HFO06_18600 [Rhizobium leguminosarum]|uniref:hypothetical protein n=1 Tax=Rhizobium leguminosarum TaxID=384 RepID=UPI001C98A93C|nr:hypothetical protein [Rhizobium leguminosarum]MBY5765081.1 hypothetical protein [Rhizobium leguminosarum]
MVALSSHSKERQLIFPKEGVINLQDQRDLRKAYDKAVQEQFRRLGRPGRWRDAWVARARRKKSKALANADPEFYVLSRSINISATWLSVVAVTLQMELSHPDDDEEFSDEQKAALAFFSRLANDLWAIIELVECGFDLQARALARSYLEHVDVLICCIDDIELTKEFVAAVEPEASNHFWHKNVSKDKIKKRTASLVSEMLKLPGNNVVNLLREPVEAIGSILHHPTVLAGWWAAFGDRDVNYDGTYPIFPVPTAGSKDVFRVLLTHQSWLCLAMGSLPKFPHGAWGSLLRSDRFIKDRMVDDLQRINFNMMGFLLQNELF